VELLSLEELYVAELQELASSTGLFAEPLVLVAEVASDPGLKRTLNDYSETELLHKKRIEAFLRSRGAEPAAHTDQAMQALLTELAKMSAMLRRDEIRDAGLIGSLQRLGHHQIAAFGTAAALAGQLELQEEQKLLRQALEKEKQFDVLLTQLAERKVNRQARSA
jgi:ferritin-like metal-binding protein YciE